MYESWAICFAAVALSKRPYRALADGLLGRELEERGHRLHRGRLERRWRLNDHAGGDCFIGAGIDEDEGTGVAVAAVGVVDEWDGGAEGDAANVVHREGFDIFDFMEGVDIDLIFDFLDDGFGFLGGVADDELCAGWHGFG